MQKTLDIVAILDSVPDRFKNVVAIDIQTTVDTVILTFKVVFFYSVLTKTCMINRDWQDNDITADIFVVNPPITQMFHLT